MIGRVSVRVDPRIVLVGIRGLEEQMNELHNQSALLIGTDLRLLVTVSAL